MTGSWEIQKARESRLLVVILCPPDLNVSLDFTTVLRSIQLPPGSDFMRVVGAPFGPARNQGARTALENGYHLAFLDADIRLAQHDAFIQLFNTGLDIVGGLYFQRFPPHLPVAFNEGRDDKGNIVKVPIAGWKPGDIVPATFLPSGLTLYRRGLLSRMFERFPRPFEWGVDTAPVPTEGGGQVPPFSEDFVFSFRSRQIGFQPFVMTGVWGLHECRAAVGPRWAVPYPSNEPTFGVVGVV